MFENWNGQHQIGTQFEEWCSKRGREAPPEEVVSAFNLSIDTGWATVREFFPLNRETYPNLLRNLQTFLSGAARVR